MFMVYDKRTYEHLPVYHVDSSTDGTPLFLVYIKDRWVWREANNFMLTPPWDRWKKK